MDWYVVYELSGHPLDQKHLSPREVLKTNVVAVAYDRLDRLDYGYIEFKGHVYALKVKGMKV